MNFYDYLREYWKAYLTIIFIMSIYPLTVIYTNKKIIKFENLKRSDKKNVLSDSSDFSNNSSESSTMINETSLSNEKETKSVAGASENRDITFGVSVDNYTSGVQLDALESKLSTNITTVSIFKHFEGSNSKIAINDLSFLESKGKKLIVAWEPRNPENVDENKDYLAEISGGNYDSYILEFAQVLNEYNAPVVIRFGHEMNGDWYPWGGRPNEYILAYRKVVDLIRSAGYNNISFMWCINAESSPSEPISSVGKYYPGDIYVDLIGIDGFNFGDTKDWSDWRSFSDIFTPAYNYVTRSYNKPVIIAETASAESGGNKAVWVNNMFGTLNTKFTLISEIVWFSHLKEADWRIDSTDASLKAFIENLH